MAEKFEVDLTQPGIGDAVKLGINIPQAGNSVKLGENHMKHGEFKSHTILHTYLYLCMCVYIYIYNVPVVPARGGAEVALKIYIYIYKTFLIYRTCKRRAPAKPVRACTLRNWCLVSHVTFEAPRHTSHLTVFTLHTALFTLHSSHCTLRSQHFTSHCTLKTPHFTLHTSQSFPVLLCTKNHSLPSTYLKGKLLAPKLRKSADKSLSQPGCSHSNTNYAVQLQKTL